MLTAQEVAFLDVIGTLSAGERLFVESHMADEVEIIDIGHALIGFHQFQIDAAFKEKLFDLGFLFLCCPLANEVIKGSILTKDVFLGVIDDAWSVRVMIFMN